MIDFKKLLIIAILATQLYSFANEWKRTLGKIPKKYMQSDREPSANIVIKDFISDIEDTLHVLHLISKKEKKDKVEPQINTLVFNLGFYSNYIRSFSSNLSKDIQIDLTQQDALRNITKALRSIINICFKKSLGKKDGLKDKAIKKGIHRKLNSLIAYLNDFSKSELKTPLGKGIKKSLKIFIRKCTSQAELDVHKLMEKIN